jgi:hypothetical protein
VLSATGAKASDEGLRRFVVMSDVIARSMCADLEKQWVEMEAKPIL